MGNQFTRNPEEEVVEEDEDTNCCSRYFLKCFQRRRTIDFGYYDLNEYDYVVEKLAIKYVRVSMFATTYDNYEYTRNTRQSPNTSTVFSASVQASPILPVNLSKPENSSKTMRKLRFSKQDSGSGGGGAGGGGGGIGGGGGGGKSDTVKKPSLAHSIGATSPAAELMNSLTTFNPHLKESERPPKDPYSLNITKSQRSFAEELSEAAARKNNNYTMTESVSSSSTPGTSKQL